jgi:hypothetical protein
MKSIDKHIEELLYHYDCVIIPEFGGFITSDATAYIDKKSSTIYPPSKRILFNKNLQNNDGLLANKLVKDDGLSYQDANQYLIQFRDSCFLSLDEKGRVEVEKVGVLFFDKEKNLQFQQAKNNFLTKSFGLPSKFLTPIGQETLLVKEEVIPVIISRKETEVKVNRESVKVTKQQTETKPRKRARALLLPVLLIPALLGGVFVANQFGYVGESKIQISSLNPFHTIKVASYSPRLNDNKLTVKSMKIDLTKEQLIGVIVESPIEDEAVIAANILPYHVVGGCFAEIENAKTLVEQWKSKGKEAQIVGKSKGLFRVSLQGFQTRNQAQQFKEEIKITEGLSSWILKK